MSEFRVTIASSKAAGVITHDGWMGKHVMFRIQRLSDRRAFTYEGNGGGKRFELRCQLLLAAGGVVVGLPDFDGNSPDTSWKEAVVNQALEQAEQLQ